MLGMRYHEFINSEMPICIGEHGFIILMEIDTILNINTNLANNHSASKPLQKSVRRCPYIGFQIITNCQLHQSDVG